jgi:hypothetical protein
MSIGTSEAGVFWRGGMTEATMRGIGVSMPSTTRTFGLILIVLGLAAYFLTGRASVTALIPAFFGAVFVILALVARNESARKHAMHVCRA